jgi:hypothetical protein
VSTGHGPRKCVHFFFNKRDPEIGESDGDGRYLYLFISGTRVSNRGKQALDLELMAVTDAQKAAVEQVIQAIKSVSSPRKKRVIADLFLDLVDKETWADYYQVTLRHPVDPCPQPCPIIGHSPTQVSQWRRAEAPGRILHGPTRSLRRFEPGLLERALLQRTDQPDIQRRGDSQGVCNAAPPALPPRLVSSHSIFFYLSHEERV